MSCMKPSGLFMSGYLPCILKMFLQGTIFLLYILEVLGPYKGLDYLALLTAYLPLTPEKITG